MRKTIIRYTSIKRVPIKCETKQKRNETKSTKTKRNEINEMETKPTKQTDMKKMEGNKIKDKTK